MAVHVEGDWSQAVEPQGWDGLTLKEMLETSERLFAESGRYWGMHDLPLMSADPIGYEKLFSRIRGGLVSARETALNISASPIVKELGELCFALYTPEGDSIALSTGIIVHVHTMSEAIKWMVRNDYESNPRIRPGDIFSNNDARIGDVHAADVQTLVPIFHGDELVAWAGGVTHVLDVGATTPGGVPVGPTHRLEDGIDLPCIKVGERDEIARWHLERCAKRTRAPRYYLLDEKTRLAGCHMIRDTVRTVIAEEGLDRFKQFSREVIEEGRRSFKSRIREMTVPGRYRAASFVDSTLADKPQLPKRARRDFVVHAPFEVRIGGDGDYFLDLEGTSAWGWHSMNCTPSGMHGALWVQFTQSLICNDKVNDGAQLAVRTNLPEGSIANVGENEGSTGVAWAFSEAAFTGFPRTLARALQSRGFIEEVQGSYSVSGNVIQGGGTDQYGNSSALMNFEIAAQGVGANYVQDGIDAAAAFFNPEGDAGDIEMWELIAPIVYLGRLVKPNTSGPGRHRGGASMESLIMVWNTPFWEMQNVGTTRLFSSVGIFGGYPGSCSYIHNIKENDLRAQALRGEAYPVGDGAFDAPAMMSIAGEREYSLESRTLPAPFEEGDLYLSVMKGAAGLGDPLERSDASIRADIEAGQITATYAEQVYAVSDRDGRRRDRLARARPAADWWAQTRARVLAQELIDPVRVSYAESMKLSPIWAAEYRGFWDLPEDFVVDVPTPTLSPALVTGPGKVSPDDAARAFLATSTVDAFTPTVGRENGMDEAGLEALLDERLDRRGVKDIQSSFKDPDRFDTWISVLQRRVPWSERIVLPLGEALYVVRRASDGALVVKSEAGFEFCEAHQNWKMHAVMFVRDTAELLQEVYPVMAHCDPEWMELREFYCPLSGRMLETEAVIPGYPVIHDFLPDIDGFYNGWLGREVPR